MHIEQALSAVYIGLIKLRMCVAFTVWCVQRSEMNHRVDAVEIRRPIVNAGDVGEGGDGYLIGVGFDLKRQQTFGSVFDAGNLAAGPMAIIRLPYWVPNCFHGNFYSSNA